MQSQDPLACEGEQFAAQASIRVVRQACRVTSLRLFEIVPDDLPKPPRRRPLGAPSPAEDVLHASERYLAEHIERYDDLAAIQAVLSLGITPRTHVGEPDETMIDRERFPRCVQAVARVRQLLEADSSQLPEGFWPRFLLQQVSRDS